MTHKLKNKFQSVLNEWLLKRGFKLTDASVAFRLSIISGKRLPVYIGPDLSPCFTIDQATIPDKVFIITIPKSGTYLVAKLLENLGIINCNVHIATGNIQDNRFADEKAFKLEPWRFFVEIPLTSSAQLIRTGQFSFGHIPYFETEKKSLEDFKKIFTFRELRDVIISIIRFLDSLEQNFKKPEAIKLGQKFKEAPMGNDKFKYWFSLWGKEYESIIRNMLPWKERSDVFQVKFETLMGDDGKDAQLSLQRGLCGFLGLDITDAEIDKALSDSIGAETLTYSGKRSSYKDWWNGEVEDLFTHYGFKELNRLYGYE